MMDPSDFVWKEARDMAEMKYIAKIHTDFPSKFGIPRQSGLIQELKGTVVFEPEYRNPDMLRGIQGFSYIWLIWSFSESERDAWSPTVRPPRLGGNKRMGVFATRSPFRPNAVGLSSVLLDEVELHTEQGPLLHVSGVDLMDGTPIFDIKPYIPEADCHPDARGGFVDTLKERMLTVDCPPEFLRIVPDSVQKALLAVLSRDPRPSYQDDPERIYGMEFAGVNVRFRVDGDRLEVCEIQKA